MRKIEQEIERLSGTEDFKSALGQITSGVNLSAGGMVCTKEAKLMRQIHKLYEIDKLIDDSILSDPNLKKTLRQSHKHKANKTK